MSKTISRTKDCDNICHYLANIVHDPLIIKEREASFSGAGCLRSLFLARCFPGYVNIVSMGAGKRVGIFPKRHERVDAKISIYYLPECHIMLFRKKLRHFFYAIFLLQYLLWNVKKDHLVMIYNSHHSSFMIIPVLIAKTIKGFRYLLEVEEFYSSKRDQNRLNFSEHLSVRNAAGYILVSEGQLPFINLNLPWILNGGYCSSPADNPTLGNEESVTPAIIYSGRLDHDGGIDIFLKSISFINKKCNIIITGMGPREDIVRNYINHNENVSFLYLGFLSQEDYIKLLRYSHIGINPIPTHRSFSRVSFPSKILQYLEYGNLVISSKFTGLNMLDPLKEYIYCYDNDSPEALGKLIDDVLEFNFNKYQVAVATKRFFMIEKERLHRFFYFFMK